MKDCFVIMPIGSGEAYEIYFNRYKEIIEPAVVGLQENGAQCFNCVRADLVSKTGSITRDVLSRIYSSEVVIADLTDLNPNVFYELGVRHSLRSGTILIALKGTKPPFDVGDMRIIFYEDRVGSDKKVIPEIQEMLRSLLEDGRAIDSPVLQAIPQLSEAQTAKEVEARVYALTQEQLILKAKLEVSERANLASQGSLDALRQAVDKIAARLVVPEQIAAQAKIESLVQERSISKPTLLARMTDLEVNPEDIFVLMPLTPELQLVYEIVAITAKEAGLRCYRIDELHGAVSIMDQIFEKIATSGLIVADLTGRNVNVMYELGIANAMGKDLVLLAQDSHDVPFDLKHLRHIVYSTSHQGIRGLKEHLIRVFKWYREKPVEIARKKKFVGKALRLYTDYVSTRSLAVVLRDREGNATTGTSICIEVGSHLLLATAGHVIEDMNDDQIQLIPAGELSMRPVTFASRSCRPGKPAPATDVAWMELEKQVVRDHHLRFLKLSDLKPYQAFDRGRPFLVHGYPYQSAILSANQADVESTVGYTMVAAPEDLPRAPLNHEIALEYPPRDEQGKPIASAPDAFGLSGGGVWRDLRHDESLITSPEHLQLVAINTSWDKAAAILFATKIECWLDLVRHDFPDTQDEVGRLLKDH